MDSNGHRIVGLSEGMRMVFLDFLWDVFWGRYRQVSMALNVTKC